MTDLRLSTEYVEVLANLPTPSLNLATEYVEVLASLPTPSLRAATVYVEVLTTYTPPPPVVTYLRVGRSASTRASTW